MKLNNSVIYNTPSKEEIEKFCDNLKTSLLNCVSRGEQIHINRRDSSEPVYNEFRVALDSVYMGTKFIISTGIFVGEAIYKEHKRKNKIYGKKNR